MTTARTFLRFALAGLFANVMAAACIVNSDGGDGDDEKCEAGTSKDCTCSDGTESQRKCNSSGSGYGQCVCDGSSVGGSGNGSGGDGTGNTGTEAGSGNSTAGTTNTSYGGETGEGGTPATNGGAGVEPEVGGAGGGSGEVDPGICGGDNTDSCADCYQQGCCDQWTACVDDEDEVCLDEFLGIVTECSEGPRMTHDVGTAEFQACVAAQTPGGGGWSSGLSPLTVDMVNCMAGEDEGGWEGSPWGNLACKAGCFDQQ